MRSLQIGLMIIILFMLYTLNLALDPNRKPLWETDTPIFTHIDQKGNKEYTYWGLR